MNKGTTNQIIVFCFYCQDKKLFNIISTYIVEDKKNREDREYAFAVCDSCKQPSLFYREDPIGLGLEFWDYDMCVYPKDERILVYQIPEIVRESYEEAVRCEKAKASIATVVMVGRALEAVCNDFVPDSKSIMTALVKMKDDGVISEELLEWSNELRFLRNQGAHATSNKISPNDASDSIDFLQAILEILYHLRPRFNDIKKRKSSKESVS